MAEPGRAVVTIALNDTHFDVIKPFSTIPGSVRRNCDTFNEGPELFAYG